MDYIISNIVTIISQVFAFVAIVLAGKFLAGKLSQWISGTAIAVKMRELGVSLGTVVGVGIKVLAWYVAFRFIGLDFTFILQFLLTNITLMFGIGCAAFGYAWSQHPTSQNSAHKTVKLVVDRIKLFFS